MKNTWKEHCALVAEYCDVRYFNETAIWFFEDDCGYCELITGECYYCNSWDDFLLITE